MSAQGTAIMASVLLQAQRAARVELDLGEQGVISIAVLQVSPIGLALISILER
jgi:hypothetical protein